MIFLMKMNLFMRSLYSNAHYEVKKKYHRRFYYKMIMGHVGIVAENVNPNTCKTYKILKFRINLNLRGHLLSGIFKHIDCSNFL